MPSEKSRIPGTIHPACRSQLAGAAQSVFLNGVSDRLAELQHQRSLAQQQLSWLDREIARETGAPPPAANPPAVVARAAAPTVSAAGNPTAEEILAQYGQPTGNTTRDVKRGCYLYFIFALGMLVISAVSVYFIYTRLR